MGRATYIEPNVDEWLNKFHFHTDIKVRYSETDMSGHINNTSYAIYFEQVRAEYLHELDFYRSDVTVVTADFWTHYHLEAYFPDTLHAGVRVAKLGQKSLDLEYYLYSTEKQKLVATARGTLVVKDKLSNKTTQIPPQLRVQIQETEQMK